MEEESDCRRLNHLLEVPISLYEAHSKLAYVWVTIKGQALSLSI